MLDASVGGVYANSFSTGEGVAGIIDGGSDLRFDADPSNPLAPASPPAHNATNEAIVFEMFASSKIATPPPQLAYDIIDTGRQFLDNLVWDMSRLLENAYHRRDSKATSTLAKAWYDVAADLDHLLSMDARFMLGRWIARARATATTSVEADLLEYNARNQITLWGPRQNGLSDYARKQWSGLVSTYHVAGRWGTRIEAALASFGGSPYDSSKVAADVAQHELAWQTNYSQKFPTAPNSTASVLQTARALVAHYATSSSRSFRVARGMTLNASAAAAWVYVPQKAWNRRIGTLAYLCEVDPFCAAFTSDGQFIRSGFEIKYAVKGAPGVDIFY